MSAHDSSEGLDHSRRLSTEFALLDAVRYRGLIGQVVGMAIERDRVVYDVRVHGGLHRAAGGSGLLVLAEPLAAGPHLAGLKDDRRTAPTAEGHSIRTEQSAMVSTASS